MAEQVCAMRMVTGVLRHYDGHYPGAVVYLCTPRVMPASSLDSDSVTITEPLKGEPIEARVCVRCGVVYVTKEGE